MNTTGCYLSKIFKKYVLVVKYVKKHQHLDVAIFENSRLKNTGTLKS